MGDAWLVQLWNNGNTNMSRIEELFGGLAISIGTQMRNTAGTEHFDNGMTSASGTHLPGYAISLRPCIRVRWKFLSFPAVLLVAELAFFIGVIICNWHSAWDGNWKSSTLPFIFQSKGVQWPHGADDRPVKDEQDLRKAVHRVQGKLEQDQVDGVWKLSTTTKPVSQ